MIVYQSNVTQSPLLLKSQNIIIILRCKIDIKQTVGKRVKELRNKIGLSQEELADIAQLDRTYITSVERGKRNISIVNVEKLAKALQVTLAEFFTF